MKSIIIIMLIVAMAVTIAAPSAQAQAPDATKIKTSDFAWMTGRWIGRLDNATAEQICSQPQSGEMLCLFRIFVQAQPVMFEMYTLYDTPRGLELRSLNFPTNLTEKAAQQPLLMVLQKYSDKEVVFTGAPGTAVSTPTPFPARATTHNSVIMFHDTKEPPLPGPPR